MENLDNIRFENYIKAEKKFIDDAKYFEGINTHKDPGDHYILDWININASFFRDKWNNSKCKDCAKGGKCGDKLRKECGEFEELKGDNQ